MDKACVRQEIPTGAFAAELMDAVGHDLVIWSTQLVHDAKKWLG